MNKNFKQLLLIPLISLSFSATAIADKTLNNDQSSLNFVSIKKGTVGEVHQFKTIQGSMSDNGEVSISIDLTSVETGIPIRNTRMQSMLFDTDKFSTATLTASVPQNLTHGISSHSIEAKLSLHGASKIIPIDINVVNMGGSLFVSSQKPIIINAGDFGLVTGIEALRKIAKLSSIPIAVPVTFNLVFE